MPMGMGYGYYWDPTYVLVIIGAVICMIASANVSGTYKKYNRVRNSRNMTGAQVAAQILQEAGLSHIRIEHISGDLTDHYDPQRYCVCRTAFMVRPRSLPPVWQRMSAVMQSRIRSIMYRSGFAMRSFRLSILVRNFPGR